MDQGYGGVPFAPAGGMDNFSAASTTASDAIGAAAGAVGVPEPKADPAGGGGGGRSGSRFAAGSGGDASSSSSSGGSSRARSRR